MDRQEELQQLYSSSVSKGEFDFERLYCNYNINQLLSPTDIGDINYIATDVRYQGNVRKRKMYIDEIMRRRNFMKLTAGTNRIVYKFLDDQSFVCKLPIDKNGIFDNIAEWDNQLFLKPFNAKMFQRTECGTVSFSECVRPIRYKEEFDSIAGDIFDLLYKKVLGRYVMDDVGASKYMNYGIRPGFGPVFLDFPRIFVLDGGKLKCQNIVDGGFICNGEIDYDLTFDTLECKCCGKRYRARDLMDESIKTTLIYEKGVDDMRVKIFDGNGKVMVENNKAEVTSDVIIPKEEFMRVKFNRGAIGEPNIIREPEIGLDILRGTEESSMRVSFSSKKVNIKEEIKEESNEEFKEMKPKFMIKRSEDETEESSEAEEIVEDNVGLVEEYSEEESKELEEVKEEAKPIKVSLRSPEDDYETVYTDPESKAINAPLAESLKNAVKEKEKKEIEKKKRKAKGTVTIKEVGKIVSDEDEHKEESSKEQTDKRRLI